MSKHDVVPMDDIPDQRRWYYYLPLVLVVGVRYIDMAYDEFFVDGEYGIFSGLGPVPN